jgi:hypothetical protein
MDGEDRRLVEGRQRGIESTADLLPVDIHPCCRRDDICANVSSPPCASQRRTCVRR